MECLVVAWQLIPSVVLAAPAWRCRNHGLRGHTAAPIPFTCQASWPGSSLAPRPPTLAATAAAVAVACLLAVATAQGGATLGEVQPARAIPAGYFIHQSVVVGDCIYVLGGGGGRYVFFTKVQTDGTLAPWQATTPIAEGLGFNYTTAVAHGRCIYLLGGMYQDAKTGASVTAAAVGIARAKDDGMLGPWQTTAALPEPRAGGAAVVAGKYLYYLGGGQQRRVFYAPLLDSGDLGAWKETQRLISNRCSFSAFATDRYVYAVGGGIILDRCADTVFRAALGADGALGPWRRTEPLPEGLSGYGGVLVGRDVFLFGGTPARNTVYATTIGADDHFGPWQTLAPLPFGASTVQAVYVNGAVYLTGGMIPNGDGRTAQVLNTVYRIPVRPAPPK